MRLHLFRNLLYSTPALLGAITLLLPTLILGWNLAAQAVGANAWRFHGMPLSGGEVQTTKPTFTWNRVWTGQFAREYTRYFTRSLPFFSAAVRLRNQVYYSVGYTSTVPSIVIGRGSALFETPYIDEYCSRDLTSFAPKAKSWAQHLRQVQDYYEARHRAFLYVITPSKAAVYPEHLPANWPCGGHDRDKQQLLPVYHQALERHGVHYVDTAVLVATAKPDYALGVFPRGGTHWNDVGSALGTQAMIRALNRDDLADKLHDFTFTWRPGEPEGPDWDLVAVLNLIWPDRSYVVPKVTLHPVPQSEPRCAPLRLTFVGGSFVSHFVAMLARFDCKPNVSFWFYFHRLHITSSGAQPLTPELAKLRDHELTAGMGPVIFEENEGEVARSEHLKAVFTLLEPLFAD